MKAVLMSIHPKWCAPILNGLKIIEIRKSKPNLKPPFKAYIYCTKKGGNLVLGDRFDGYGFTTEYTITRGISREKAEKIWGVLNGKVIGEFVCDEVIEIMYDYEDYHLYDISDDDLKDTCLSQEELFAYGKGKPLYGWHISNLVMYEKPKELKEFLKPCNKDFEDLIEEEILCKYCRMTNNGENKAMLTPYGISFCEGAFCDSAYEAYRRLYRPPQSWCHVEEVS